MCTGRVPFTGEEPLAVLHAHAEEPVPSVRELNPALPEGVEGIIRRALAKHPVDRYQRAGELATALEWATSEVMRERPMVVKEREIAPEVQTVPRRLDFGLVRGSASMTLSLVNEKSKPLDVVITSTKAWMTVSPRSLELSRSESAFIKVSVSTEEMEKVLEGLFLPFVRIANRVIRFDGGEISVPVKMRGWSKKEQMPAGITLLIFFTAFFTFFGGVFSANLTFPGNLLAIITPLTPLGLYCFLLLVNLINEFTWRLPVLQRWVVRLIWVLVFIWGVYFLLFLIFR
jgi:serine/threonine protein kinase